MMKTHCRPSESAKNVPFRRARASLGLAMTTPELAKNVPFRKPRLMTDDPQHDPVLGSATKKYTDLHATGHSPKSVRAVYAL